MSKLFSLGLVFLAIINACSAPNTSNVIIDSNGSTLYYDYFAYLYSGINYDAYWPELKIVNASNANATISFSYSFYVCGYKQTASSLNKTVNLYAPKGISYWEMNEDDSMLIESIDTCGGSYIDVNDVDFEWTVLSVTTY